MRIHFDPKKNEHNLRSRGLSFESVLEFDFDSALVMTDERHDYGEIRYVALGYLGSRLHVVCFTEEADGIRVISLRKANTREIVRYAKAQATH